MNVFRSRVERPVREASLAVVRETKANWRLPSVQRASVGHREQRDAEGDRVSVSSVRQSVEC